MLCEVTHCADMLQSIRTNPLNFTGVIWRLGLPLYAQNAVRWLASFMRRWKFLKCSISSCRCSLNFIACYDTSNHNCHMLLNIWGNRMYKLVVRITIITLTKKLLFISQVMLKDRNFTPSVSTSLSLCDLDTVFSLSPVVPVRELFENLAIETSLFLI